MQTIYSNDYYIDNAYYAPSYDINHDDMDSTQMLCNWETYAHHERYDHGQYVGDRRYY